MFSSITPSFIKKSNASGCSAFKSSKYSSNISFAFSLLKLNFDCKPEIPDLFKRPSSLKSFNKE